VRAARVTSLPRCTHVVVVSLGELLRRPKRVWVGEALRDLSAEAMEKARKIVFKINRRKAAKRNLPRHWDGLNGEDFLAWRKEHGMIESDDSSGTDESSFSRRGLVRVTKLKDYVCVVLGWSHSWCATLTVGLQVLHR